MRNEEEDHNFSTELIDTLEALDYDLTEAWVRWRFFEQLYASSEARVELLNKSARTFFFFLQRDLQDIAYLSLSRLLDPAKNRQQNNLSVARLIEMIRKEGSPKLAKLLNKELKKISEASEDIRWHRNKRIAHNDLNTHNKAVFTRMSRKNYVALLKSTSKLLNLIHQEIDGSEFGHEYFQAAGDGESLTYWIAQGIRMKNLQMELLREEITAQQIVHILKNEFPRIDH